MQPPDPLSRLVRGLDLEEIRADVFRARTGASTDRLFGGLLLAQSVMAAGRTVHGRHLHSLHASFLRPGRSRVPLELAVERLRDGRSFGARRITGTQSHDVTIVATASFTTPSHGISHQDPMPDAPDPEGLPDWEDVRAATLGAERRNDVAVELRVCDADPASRGEALPAYRRVWIRPRGTLPDDPLIHAAMLVFSTDRTLLRVAARPHGPIWSVRNAASLDHAVWLHDLRKFDDWVLYVCESPVAVGGRALAFGAMYGSDGRRILSVAQEGLLRF
jgi:acyl-CoA thioesterase-2